jgi:hypothetical protein
MADTYSGRTFTKFPKLPKEIRLMIWKAALPGPRVVTIRLAPLKFTIGEWNEMTEAERAANSGRPADTESLYARMREGIGAQKLWQLAEGLPTECVEALGEASRDTPHLSFRLVGRDFPESFDRMDDMIQDSFPEGVPGDAIMYHLRQGVPIDCIRTFLGLPNEREVRLLIFASCYFFNPYISTYGKPIDCPDPVLTRNLTGIKSNRLPIQTLYACRESREVALGFLFKSLLYKNIGP